MTPLAALLLAAPAAGPAFPLAVSENRRHLVDAAGRPFLVHADTGWFAPQRLTLDETAQYLDQRKRLGFTTILLHLLAEPDSDHDRNGRFPLLDMKARDLTKPNPAYFDRAARVFALARERGLYLLVAPAWLSCCEGGWRATLKANGPAKCRAFGEFVGKRFGGFDNVGWIVGGDRDPGEFRPEVEALAAGLHAAAPRHLKTAHCTSPNSSRDQYDGAPWLSVNSTYTYGPSVVGVGRPQLHVYAAVARDHARTPPMPAVLLESSYEGERKASRQVVRRQAYWALLSGAAGHAFGNGSVYKFDDGWRAALDGPGSRDMQRVAALFAGRRWHELVPDRGHKYVTTGFGTFDPNAGADPNYATGFDYATTAATPDGKLLLAYVPTGPRTLTLDRSRLAAGVGVKWYDPTDGSVRPVRLEPGGGPVALAPPGPNAGGDADWVLVAE